jgi:hypothetical protein
VRRIGLVAALLLLAVPAAAQDVGALLGRTLGQGAAALYWLPNSADAAAASEAIGVAYLPIVGAAGNVDIAVGYYTRGRQGFALAAPVSGLFGQEPREPSFLPDRIELTTTMPRPEDPRCCPTGTARWSIDRRTMTATRIR